MLPQTAIAQTSNELGPGTSGELGNANNNIAGEALQPTIDKITLPTELGNAADNTSSEQVQLVIKCINKTTSRLLGGVKITLEGGDDKGEVTLPDPPKEIDGELVFKIIPGTYKITASRAGYRTLSEEQDLSGENLKLTIQLEPLSSTPDPEAEFSRRLQLLQMTQAMNQSNQTYPYNQNYPYQNSYPYTSNTGYTGYQTPQNGYVYSSNQALTAPLVVNIPAFSLMSGFGNYDIRIIDPTTGNEVSLMSYSNTGTNNYFSSTYQNINKYACLRPGQPYILRFRSLNTYDTYSSDTDNYQDFTFQSATLGGYTKAQIIEQQVGLSIIGPHPTIGQPIIQNLALQGANLPINCPMTGYANSYSPAYNSGNTTWGDQTVSPNLIGSYRVERPQYSSQYFLVNNSVYNDARPITFVENNAGDGGLAFVPAQSGNLYSSNYSSSQWYVTTYTRNISSQVSTCKTYVSDLIKKTEFARLDSALQAKAKNDVDSLSSSSLSNKEKLNLCLAIKTSLASGYQLLSVAIPAMNNTEIIVNINTSKFTRVNLTPDEYKRAVAGQTLQNFDVKQP